MAALLHAIVCHSVTTVHSCCVLRLAHLSVVCGPLAGCGSAEQPYSVFVKPYPISYQTSELV